MSAEDRATRPDADTDTTTEPKLRTSDIAERGPHSERADATERGTDGDTHDSTSLFAESDAQSYRTRWQEVQSRFVDSPREAVEDADKLVAEVIQQLAAVFADQQKELESELQQSGKLSTEDLRIALRRYRSFFDRLLAV